jgi:hypothetical protein
MTRKERKFNRIKGKIIIIIITGPRKNEIRIKNILCNESGWGAMRHLACSISA